MPKLIALGTSASVPDADHDTIALLLRGPRWAIPIDCGGSPLYKLSRLGVELDHIHAVILTHRHADHVYGLPILVQGLWLSGRGEPLPIHGPKEALDLARRLLKLFDLDEREGMFTIEWHAIPLVEKYHVLEVEAVTVTSTPVEHFDLETVGLRFDNTETGRSLVYSADTAPCGALKRLAEGANFLLHEASGSAPGHTSPSEAGKLACEVGVDALHLIHYPVRDTNLEAWRQAAAQGFSGPVHLAQDGEEFPF